MSHNVLLVKFVLAHGLCFAAFQRNWNAVMIARSVCACMYERTHVFERANRLHDMSSGRNS